MIDTYQVWQVSSSHDVLHGCAENGRLSGPISRQRPVRRTKPNLNRAARASPMQTKAGLGTAVGKRAHVDTDLRQIGAPAGHRLVIFPVLRWGGRLCPNI